MSVDDLVQLYDQQLSQLLDRHCPEVTVHRRNKQATPWFDADYQSARRYARATERWFRRTRSDTQAGLVRQIQNDAAALPREVQHVLEETD